MERDKANELLLDLINIVDEAYQAGRFTRSTLTCANSIKKILTENGFYKKLSARTINNMFFRLDSRMVFNRNKEK